MIRILLSSVLASALALAQTPTPAQRILGEVTEIDTTGATFVVKLDKAEETPTKTVTQAGALQYKRVAPGEKDLTKAAPSKFEELAAGDRVLVRGKSVIVMAKNELVKKHATDQEEWSKRGMSGLVVAVMLGSSQIVVEGRGSTPGAPSKPVSLLVNDKTQFRRYAPDSVKFSDAKVAELKDVSPEDQLRVLGNKSEDGTKLDAEMIVFGTFRTLAATITKIDAATGMIEAKTFETKPVKVNIIATKDSTIKKLPEMMARMLGMAGGGGAAMGGMRGGGGPGTAGGEPGGGRPAGAGGPQAGGPPERAAGGRPAGMPPGGPGGPGGFAGGMRGAGGGPGGAGVDFHSMLDRVPAIALSDMKAGDQIIVSSTKSAKPDHVTAITILAGVEQFLAARQAAAPGRQGGVNANWNMDIPVL